MFVEHVNLTVTEPRSRAELFCRLFDWHIRWEGPSMLGGNTVHVGDDNSYLALYTIEGASGPGRPGGTVIGINHIGVVVDDLDEVAARVHAEGIETFSHETYEPGSRFYFLDPDGIEYEVVSYS